MWLFSDRPPLETGFALLQWPLWGGHTQLGYQLLSTGLQVSWLPALWTVLRVRGLGAGRVSAVVLMTAATGAVFFNTIYVWPKMLAGSLALAALAILVSRDDDDRWAGAGILAAALATLSMLAHGGTAFALLALAPFVYRQRRRITVRAVAVGAAVAAVLYLPWTLFQHFVDPPGNRLMKWMLAGVIPVTRKGVLEHDRAPVPVAVAAPATGEQVGQRGRPGRGPRHLAHADVRPGLDQRIPGTRADRAAVRRAARRRAAAARPARAAVPVRAAGRWRRRGRWPPSPRWPWPCGSSWSGAASRCRRSSTRDLTRSSSCSSGCARWR